MSSKSIKILILEDNVYIADFIKEFLNREEYMNVEVAYDLLEFNSLINTLVPDLLLLDVNIDGKDKGLEVAKEYCNTKKIIFITGQNDIKTIEKAVVFNPIGYLTKPIRRPELLASIRLVESQLRRNTITLKSGYSTYVIAHDDILYVKSALNYIDVFTASQKITVRVSLDNLLLELNNNNFTRVHRSYIVNKNKITNFNSKFIYIGDLEIPISRGLKFE